MKKTRKDTNFGARLRTLRKSRGLTQTQLGTAIGMSKRMMAYYEQQDAQPPGAILGALAKALNVSADELLGITPARPTISPKTAKLLKRVERIGELDVGDQRAILKIIDGFLEGRTKTRRHAA